MIFAGVAVGNLAGLQLAHGQQGRHPDEARLLTSGASSLVLLKRLLLGDSPRPARVLPILMH